MLIFIVRHGERADDNCLKEQHYIEVEYDPQLTLIGQNQAEQVGIKIASYIQGKKVKIITSPFLRCYQTSLKIAEVLGTTQLDVSRAFAEWMKHNWFSSNILEQLGVLKNKLLQEDGNFEEKITLPKYPECLEEYYERIVNNLDKIIQSNESQDCLIVVTHGIAVQCILESQQLFQCEKDVGYCNLSVFEYKDQKLNCIESQQNL